MNMLPTVFESCKTCVSADILNLCSELLGTMPETDEVFDDIYPFLMSCIDTAESDVQYASLKCLSSLARGSKIKCTAMSDEIIAKLVAVLSDETPKETFKCKGRAADKHKQQIDRHSQKQRRNSDHK